MTVPADLTPDRLREMAASGYIHHYPYREHLRRWADELEAAPPDPAVPFPVGARVVDCDCHTGEVLAVHGDARWVLLDGFAYPRNHLVSNLSPAPSPTVEVPADVVARALAGTLTDEDRAVLARAGEGE